MSTRKKEIITGVPLMRFSASCVSLMAFAQIYCGLKAYLFKVSPDIRIRFVGAYWVGLYLLLPGILGMFSSSRVCVISGFVSGLLGIAFSFGGIAIDGSAYSTYLTLKACGQSIANNPNITKKEDILWFGNSSYAVGAQYCAFFNPEFDCSCTNDFMDMTFGPSPRCYTFQFSPDNPIKNSCNSIIKEYPLLLEASFGICIVCVSIVSAYCFFAGLSLFWPTVYERDYYELLAQEDERNIVTKSARFKDESKDGDNESYDGNDAVDMELSNIYTSRFDVSAYRRGSALKQEELSESSGSSKNG